MKIKIFRNNIKSMKITIQKLTYKDFVIEGLEIQTDNNTDTTPLCSIIEEIKKILEPEPEEEQTIEPIEQTEPEEEQPEKKELTRDILLTEMIEKYDNLNTRKNYISKLKIMLYPDDIIDNVFSKPSIIIERINSHYNTTSSRKFCYAILQSVMKHFNYETNKIDELLKKTNDKHIIEKHHEEKNTIDDAFNVFNVKIPDFMEKYKDCPMKYSLLYFIQNFGVLRPNEFMSIKLNTYDTNKDNYYDDYHNCIVLNKHKTSQKNGKRTIELDDTLKMLLITIMKTNVEYWITNNNNEPLVEVIRLVNGLEN